MIDRLSNFFMKSRVFSILMGAIALVVCYSPQLQDIFTMSTRGTDRGYVLLVPLVAVYLAFIRRTRWKIERRTQACWVGLFFVFISFLMSWYGHDRDLLAVWQMAVVMAFIGLCISAFGLFRIVALAPAFFIIPAIVPMPGGIRQALAQPLQGMATTVTAWVLNLLGVDAVRMGSLIEINGFQVAVGEACNGMRLLLPLAIVMYAFVFSLPLRVGTRALLLGLCLPVALICNVLRLVPTALAYGYFPANAELVHDVGGWLMIPLAIGMLVGCLRLMEWADLSVARFRLATA